MSSGPSPRAGLGVSATDDAAPSAETLVGVAVGSFPVAVPDFQTLMRPLLASLEAGDDLTITSIREELAERFALSQEDLDERIPSGRVTTFQNRVGWAATSGPDAERAHGHPIPPNRLPLDDHKLDATRTYVLDEELCP